MNYIVSTCTNDGQEIKIEVSVRSDAKEETVFCRCAERMFYELSKRKLVPHTVTYRYDFSNVWRNGGVGALWFEKPFYNICIARKDSGVYIAY